MVSGAIGHLHPAGAVVAADEVELKGLRPTPRARPVSCRLGRARQST